jgi:hypothetical protein
MYKNKSRRSSRKHGSFKQQVKSYEFMSFSGPVHIIISSVLIVIGIRLIRGIIHHVSMRSNGGKVVSGGAKPMRRGFRTSTVAAAAKYAVPVSGQAQTLTRRGVSLYTTKAA